MTYTPERRDLSQTMSGKIIDIDNPQPESFTIEDIAHGLAHNCRFAGQVSTFWSVADHSCTVAKIVMRMGRSTQDVMQALLHDSVEAYTNDIPSPYKIRFAGIKDIENRFLEVIYSKFIGKVGLEHMPAWLKLADDEALKVERQILFGNRIMAKPDMVRSRCEFLNMFNELYRALHLPKFVYQSPFPLKERI